MGVKEKKLLKTPSLFSLLFPMVPFTSSESIWKYSIYPLQANLPDGCAEYTDPKHGFPYFFNEGTGETTWERSIRM